MLISMVSVIHVVLIPMQKIVIVCATKQASWKLFMQLLRFSGNFSVQMKFVTAVQYIINF